MSDSIIDARGQRCPGPIIALAGAVRTLSGGTRLTLLSDDPGAETDVPAWCRLKGVQYLGPQPVEDGPGTAYLLVLPD